jgi:hypothetical protein
MEPSGAVCGIAGLVPPDQRHAGPGAAPGRGRTRRFQGSEPPQRPLRVSLSFCHHFSNWRDVFKRDPSGAYKHFVIDLFGIGK